MLIYAISKLLETYQKAKVINEMARWLAETVERQNGRV